MKTSSFASLLFGAAAIAAPLDLAKRDQTTEVHWTTVVVYTTVFDDALPTASASVSAAPAAAFFEDPAGGRAKNQPPAPVATPVDAPEVPAVTPTPAAPVAPTEVAADPTPMAPAPTVAPEEPTAATPTPVVPEAPTSSVTAPQPAAPAEGGGGYENVDVTVYTEVGNGACGMLDSNTNYVALSIGLMGPATYDYMTGLPTNKWCGQRIAIHANGQDIEATIMDLCPGCKGNDIDVGHTAWKALGMNELTRIKGSWRPI